jgi:hypothetical protein
MADKQFVKGFKVSKKEGKYGTFLKCGVNIEVFCENNLMNDKGYVNFTIFENKEGKPYAVIDTYGTEQNNLKDDENIVQFADEDSIPF